jgi:hypothetical protein
MWWRCDPVPGTRCRSGARYGIRWYRYPRTTQELRQYYAYPEFVRGRRRPRYLPHAWDDIYREICWNHKSWKLYRKTQWR